MANNSRVENKIISSTFLLLLNNHRLMQPRIIEAKFHSCMRKVFFFTFLQYFFRIPLIFSIPTVIILVILMQPLQYIFVKDDERRQTQTILSA